MAATEATPLVLFSGLAADAEVFTPQKLAFPDLIVPDWPAPVRNDTFISYCDRLADRLRPYEAAVIGGASFGGIVALHVASRLQPRAVVLIGSARSPDELSALARFARPLKPLVPLIPVRFLQLLCAPTASSFAQQTFPHLCAVARQFRRADAAVFKWSLARILDWNETPNITCPVYQVHGDRDFVLPIRHTAPDVIVAGGGHIISLTHPKEVNDFIRSIMTQIVDDSCNAPEVSDDSMSGDNSHSTAK